MSTLYLTRGLPGSGKTTLARRMVEAADGKLVRLNRDDFRAMMGSGRTGEIEREVTAAQHAAIDAVLRAGRDVIVDDTNLVTAHMRTLHWLGWRAGARVEVTDLDVPLEECLARDALRAQPVGEQVIRDMHRRYFASGKRRPVIERPALVPGEPYVPDLTKPTAFMVDVDGTVALMRGRGPYDTSRYDEDHPNKPVIAVVRALRDAGHLIIFCSGRSDEFREVTNKWLAREVLAPDALFMRAAGDMRPDHVVKLELFDRYIRGHFNVLGVFDDRDQVVHAWRGISLTVHQVAEGAF